MNGSAEGSIKQWKHKEEKTTATTTYKINKRSLTGWGYAKFIVFQTYLKCYLHDLPLGVKYLLCYNMYIISKEL